MIGPFITHWSRFATFIGILGILGAVVGGWLFGVLGIYPNGGLVASIIVAFVGAVVLIWLTRLLKRA